MSGSRILPLAALVVAIAGCTATRQDANTTFLQTPIQVQLGQPGSPQGPIRVRSGQLISLPLCCPPVEFRDAKGRLVSELKYIREPQPVVAVTGTYSIVGHEPSGGECVLRLLVTDR